MNVVFATKKSSLKDSYSGEVKFFIQIWRDSLVLMVLYVFKPSSVRCPLKCYKDGRKGMNVVFATKKSSLKDKCKGDLTLLYGTLYIFISYVFLDTPVSL